jgi:uncharacterized ion transporter superfamily protein YfcC
MSRFRFPDAMHLLLGCILLAMVMTWLVPAGEYDRTLDEGTGRTVVVAGTYEPVESAPVGLFDAMVAIPRGLVDAGDVVFLVLLIGGAFTVVDQTGALRRWVGWLADRMGKRELLVIPVISLLFATGGVLENMQEEIIALIPVLLILGKRVGFTPLVVVGMSAGAAFIGSSFSPVNPFQVGIAQNLAELPLGSGGAFRTAFLALALAFWIASLMRFAQRNRVPSEAVAEGGLHEPMTSRDALVLGLVLVTFVLLVWGLVTQGWGFNHLSGLFFLMGLVVGGIGRLGFQGTADAYARGFREMAYAAVLIGFARAITVVLEDGRILDTLVQAMFVPVEGLPTQLSALGMMASHVAVHVPVSSVSSQAVLTMPVLVPLSDLLGISRQVAVLAYQYGAGLCDFITPTNGSLLAILAAAGVRYDQWFKFALPRFLILMGLASVAVVLAVSLQL